MSKNKVSIDKLGSAIQEYLENYKEDIEEDVVELSNKYTKEAKNELQQISPKSKKDVHLKGGGVQESGAYAKSWTMKNGQKAKNIYSKIVYNKEYYRLTHLLEFGHATRNGGHTKAIPHIRPTEDKYREKFTEELERKIRRQ